MRILHDYLPRKPYIPLYNCRHSTCLKRGLRVFVPVESSAFYAKENTAIPRLTGITRNGADYFIFKFCFTVYAFEQGL
jgi:hypothetical protein